VSDETAHLDVAGYALGVLDASDREAFEKHLGTCADCRRELDGMRAAADLLALAGEELPAPPRELEARTLRAVERAARERTPSRTRAGWRRRLAPVLVAAAVVAAVTAGVIGMAGDSQPPVEAVADLRSGERTASVSLVKTGIGRVVELRTDDLAILPKGEYYELWFVGPGDRPGRPNRISAGTFHPDEKGRSNVTFAAAVDPVKYPRMAITAEPADGDPSPARRDVLAGRVDLR
jgi:anti-sigma-K factor RskA